MPHVAQPVVEVLRGGIAESVHSGRIAICAPDGELNFSFGDVEQAIFPRSAIKLIQALQLVESGAADACRFDAEQLALATASHNGEARHAACAARMLQASGATPEALECGVQTPMGSAAAEALFRAGERATALHNNCSGKHSGMIATARHLGEATDGYIGRTHPVQQRVQAAFEDVCGVELANAPVGIDGCSVPTWALPLAKIAAGFARLSNGTSLGATRSAAAARLIQSGLKSPAFVAGEHRFCTTVMQRLGSAAYIKTGAEGVFCGLLPGRGVGIALKIDDGSTRASEVAMAAVLSALLPEQAGALANLREVTLRNWNKFDVGTVQPSPELTEALRQVRLQ